MDRFNAPTLCEGQSLRERMKERELQDDYEWNRMFISYDDLDSLLDDLSPFFDMTAIRLKDLVISKFSHTFVENNYWSRAGIKYELQKMLLQQLDNRIDVDKDKLMEDRSGM